MSADVWRSGSEALDAAEAEGLLTELFSLGVPDSGMSVTRRQRAYRQRAELTGQLAEVWSALARCLEAEGLGGR